MSDDFLDELKRNWREQDAEVEGVATRLRRGLLYQRIMLWLEIAVGVLGPVFGLVMTVLGVQRSNAFLTIGGLSVVLSAPLFAWLAWRVRKSEPELADDTPQGVLRQMIERTHTTERLMRLCRWQGWALVGLTAALWAASPSGFVDTDHRLMLITVLFLGSALWAFGWALWRERGARRERARCRELLAEYR
ncbi:MAG: hypothetical protein K1X35_02830 [Caulobacteraceae bacterium]|nr:hypothetical protein [Caulobacteraceae bacterium]